MRVHCTHIVLASNEKKNQKKHQNIITQYCVCAQNVYFAFLQAKIVSIFFISIFFFAFRFVPVSYSRSQ